MAPELDQRYPPLATAPRRARHDIAVYLDAQGLAQLVPIAALLVSELVTNSLMHAGGAIGLRARLVQHSLHVEVDDRSPQLPCRHEPDLGGRGLQIVDALATEWGVIVRDEQGKATWFELRLV
jgi:two-component sensor histidine kinase